MSVTSGFEMAFPLLTDELKRAMYHDFVKISEMKAPHGLKCRILGEVFSQNPYSWRIVGITTQALECFRQTNFVRASRMGVNRSHLVDRNGTYTKLLTNDHSFDQW